MTEILLFMLAGILSGLVTGLSGANGMGIVLSILLIADKNILDAIGTCLLVQIVVVSFTLASLLKNREFDLSVTIVMSLPAGICVYFGAQTAMVLPETILTVLIAFFLYFIAVRLIRANNSSGQAEERGFRLDPESSLYYPVLGITGGLSGFLFGLAGGGGTIMIMNALHRFLNVDFNKAFFASLVIALCSSIFGAMTYIGHDHVDLKESLYVVFPAIFVVVIANSFRMKITSENVRVIQGYYLIVAATLILAKVIYECWYA